MVSTAREIPNPNIVDGKTLLQKGKKRAGKRKFPAL